MVKSFSVSSVPTKHARPYTSRFTSKNNKDLAVKKKETQRAPRREKYLCVDVSPEAASDLEDRTTYSAFITYLANYISG